MCNEEIKDDEIENAIKQLSTGKSPGIDGITNKFYKKFKTQLIPVLKAIYEEIFKDGGLSETMKTGMIKLVYKKKGDKADLKKNFRPITMLNTDFKILAKVLANQLKRVLPEIITTTQAYSVEGRDIVDMVSGIRDTMGYMQEKNEKGYLISIDFEKAFEVEYQYMYDVFKKIGFREGFRK